MVLICVSNIYICFEIFETYFYEEKQERNDQVALIILNMEQLSLDNHNENSKYSSILESLVHYLYKYNDIMNHHHRVLNVFVNYLEIFDSCI